MPAVELAEEKVEGIVSTMRDQGASVRGAARLTRTEALSGHHLRAYATASCVAEYCCTSASVRYRQSPVI
jgi:hypothetical protein